MHDKISNNSKHIIINEIVLIRQLLFSHVTFLPSTKVSVVLNISSSHAYTNLPVRRFLHEQFLVLKYPSILNALLYFQSHVLGFHI